MFGFWHLSHILRFVLFFIWVVHLPCCHHLQSTQKLRWWLFFIDVAMWEDDVPIVYPAFCALIGQQVCGWEKQRSFGTNVQLEPLNKSVRFRALGLGLLDPEPTAGYSHIDRLFGVNSNLSRTNPSAFFDMTRSLLEETKHFRTGVTTLTFKRELFTSVQKFPGENWVREVQRNNRRFRNVNEFIKHIIYSLYSPHTGCLGRSTVIMAGKKDIIFCASNKKLMLPFFSNMACCYAFLSQIKKVIYKSMLSQRYKILQLSYMFCLFLF